MKSKKSVVSVIVSICLLGIFALGIYKIFGDTAMYPFLFLLEGNGKEYRLENVETLQGSYLYDKTLLFLGSSVTKGYGSCGISFADYLGKKYGFTVYKEAVSGTTLVTLDDTSYIPRLMGNSLSSFRFDAVVCQLSTNDAKKGLPLGKIGTFDESTIIGAIETIIRYVEDLWGCPVIFYTGTHYDSENYDAMVKALYDIQKKWDIEIIDLWNEEIINNIPDEKRKLYMLDDIHPTMAGYLEWWLPPMEEVIVGVLTEEKN